MAKPEITVLYNTAIADLNELQGWYREALNEKSELKNTLEQLRKERGILRSSVIEADGRCSRLSGEIYGLRYPVGKEEPQQVDEAKHLYK